MNDEFLHALRRDPPAQFKHDLRRKLQAQDRKLGLRSVRTWTALLLIAGTAVAGGMWVFNKRSGEDVTLAPSSAQPAAEAPIEAADRSVSTAPAFVPEAREASSLEYAEETFGAPANDAILARSHEASEAANGPTPPAAEQSAGGGAIRGSSASTKIAASELTDPLIRNVLERLNAQTRLQIPPPEVMEAAAAFARLCTQAPNAQFDIVVTERRITHEEFVACRRVGITSVHESKPGYLALVLTSVVGSTPMKLSARDVYLAIAKQIPDPSEPTRIIPNPNVTWDQVDPKLEYRPIALYGPARQSHLRSLFEKMILEPGCHTHRELERLQGADPERHTQLCHTVRTDRLYSEVEQTASLIPQNLWADTTALVLVEYNFYRENQAQLSVSALEGPEPTSATIANGTYLLARPMYVYANLSSPSGVRNIILGRLQPLQLHGPNRYGFVRLDEQEGRAQQSRRSQVLSESDLVNERSESR